MRMTTVSSGFTTTQALTSGGAAAVCALASPGASAQDAPATESKPGGATLSIATWGEAYGQSQEVAYFQPFTQKTGIKIKTETYDGTLSAIKDKIGGNSSPFDIVDLSQGALDALCRDGLLESIDSDDPTALVGLPLIRTCDLLRGAGIDPLAAPGAASESSAAR